MQHKSLFVSNLYILCISELCPDDNEKEEKMVDEDTMEEKPTTEEEKTTEEENTMD